MKLCNYLCLSILNRTWHKFNFISQTNCRLWTNFAAYVIERWIVWDVCLIFNDFYFYLNWGVVSTQQAFHLTPLLLQLRSQMQNPLPTHPHHTPTNTKSEPKIMSIFWNLFRILSPSENIFSFPSPHTHIGPYRWGDRLGHARRCAHASWKFPLFFARGCASASWFIQSRVLLKLPQHFVYCKAS